jgi:hypothetical protein
MADDNDEARISNDEGMTKKEPANHTNRREKIPTKNVIRLIRGEICLSLVRVN